MNSNIESNFKVVFAEKILAGPVINAWDPQKLNTNVQHPLKNAIQTKSI